MEKTILEFKRLRGNAHEYKVILKRLFANLF